ncbi:hypothetical protein PUN28_005668 [Cardiocondyla obscurior]|uniref:Uncharacterized protein n=1 Tax=Cardiocondyla obscurior TaxID=286306 RepID=A0AAW2G798_9HYME
MKLLHPTTRFRVVRHSLTREKKFYLIKYTSRNKCRREINTRINYNATFVNLIKLKKLRQCLITELFSNWMCIQYSTYRQYEYDY